MIYHPQPVQPAIGVGGVVYGQQVPTTVQYPGIKTIAIQYIKSFIKQYRVRQKTSSILKPYSSDTVLIIHTVGVNLRRD